MSEETLHVNEFEKDTKPVYRSERNLQQRYGPEANFSYRAHSAEEILSDKALLREKTGILKFTLRRKCP